MTDERKTSWRQLAAFLLVVAMSTFAVVMVQVDASADRRRDKASAEAQLLEARRQALGQCLQGNDVRVQVRDLIQLTLGQGGSAPGFDLTAFPSFPALDPSMKAWVRDLQKQLSGGGNPDRTRERLQAALDKVPLRDCGAEFPGLEPRFPPTAGP